VKKTSIFRGNISQIVLNPSWGIPTSMVKNEILPKIRSNSNYLAQNNIEVINGNYRQKPGKNNALGKMKFLFPNHFNIYLHDTPSKSLFGATNRAFSHGCIRVENPKKLVLYLLRKKADWNEERVDNILGTDNETLIKLMPTVPVYIAYFTAWVDNTGQLNFRNDLYHLDEKLSIEIFGN
jgi:murein L,D-transpeptidase YcbB/YkuD